MATLPLEKIENVFFYYANIAEPKFKFGSTTEKEYGVTVFMSKQAVKDFKKLNLNKTPKEVDNADFEARYKTPVPFPDQDEQYFINVTQNVAKQNGELLSDFLRPKTYLKGADGRITLATDTLVGNGSKGTLRYITRETTASPKPSLKLNAILVTDLIPYVRAGGSDDWANAASESSSNVDQDPPF